MIIKRVNNGLIDGQNVESPLQGAKQAHNVVSISRSELVGYSWLPFCSMGLSLASSALPPCSLRPYLPALAGPQDPSSCTPSVALFKGLRGFSLVSLTMLTAQSGS